MTYKVYPGRIIAGTILETASWKYMKSEHNILGFLCLTIGAMFLNKSVELNV